MLIIMLYASKKNLFVYTGFFHSNNIAYILENIYKFSVIYTTGFTNNIELTYETKNNSNCIHVDREQFNFIE